MGPTLQTAGHRKQGTWSFESLHTHGLPIAIPVTVNDGDPRQVISALSAKKEFDLVVLGRVGRVARPGLLHIGRIVEYVAHHTNTPMAVIAPSGTKKSNRPGPIVVGLDGSPEAVAAVAVTATLAKALGREVVAASVRPPDSGSHRSASSDSTTQAAQARLDRWAGPLTDAGVVSTRTLVINPEPATALLDLADSVGASMLVLGTRGTGGFTGLRMGGVAMRALHRAPISLVIVPPLR